MSAQVNIEFSKKSILDLLKLGNKPLLLTLDEAQNIKDVHRLSPELIDKTKNVLDEIHNGSFNRPLILVVSGLNMTRNILQSLGISRFNNKCSFNLSALDQTSEKAIIADWLIKDVQAQGDINDWINAITQKTHQWPHHIMSYVNPAVNKLNEAHGIMSKEVLDEILVTYTFNLKPSGLEVVSVLIYSYLLNDVSSNYCCILELKRYCFVAMRGLISIF